MKYLLIAVLILTGLYTEAELTSAKHALWEIKAALEGPRVVHMTFDKKIQVMTNAELAKALEYVGSQMKAESLMPC